MGTWSETQKSVQSNPQAVLEKLKTFIFRDVPSLSNALYLLYHIYGLSENFFPFLFSRFRMASLVHYSLNTEGQEVSWWYLKSFSMWISKEAGWYTLFLQGCQTNCYSAILVSLAILKDSKLSMWLGNAYLISPEYMLLITWSSLPVRREFHMACDQFSSLLHFNGSTKTIEKNYLVFKLVLQIVKIYFCVELQ